jgi:stage III sporulation protein AG
MLKKMDVTLRRIYNDKKLIIYLIILGVIFMIIPGIFKAKSKKNDQISSNQEFINKIQNDLSNMVSNVAGAGKSKVLITLDEGEETIYATENKQNIQTVTDEGSYSNQLLKRKIDDNEKKYITTRDSNGNETPLIVKKIEPKIRGAVVLCQGASNKDVRENIIKLISIALDISTNKICVAKFRN